MWTAQRGRGSQREESQLAQIGGVTLAELPLGVYVDGERRNLPLYTPGGYSWRPSVGDSVLVIKTEEGGCVLGCPQSGAGGDDLAVGEIKISGVGCEIYLNSQGEVNLTGDLAVSGGVTINGEGLESMIERIVAANMSVI